MGRSIGEGQEQQSSPEGRRAALAAAAEEEWAEQQASRRRQSLVQGAVARAVGDCFDDIPGLTADEIADALIAEATVRDRMRNGEHR